VSFVVEYPHRPRSNDRAYRDTSPAATDVGPRSTVHGPRSITSTVYGSSGLSGERYAFHRWSEASLAPSVVFIPPKSPEECWNDIVIAAGSQMEFGARDPRLGLCPLIWRLTRPRVFVVERVNQFHCVLQAVRGRDSAVRTFRRLRPNFSAQSSLSYSQLDFSSFSIVSFGSAVGGLEGQQR
jgi:hypothetical protein